MKKLTTLLLIAVLLSIAVPALAATPAPIPLYLPQIGYRDSLVIMPAPGTYALGTILSTVVSCNGYDSVRLYAIPYDNFMNPVLWSINTPCNPYRTWLHLDTKGMDSWGFNSVRTEYIKDGKVMKFTDTPVRYTFKQILP